MFSEIDSFIFPDGCEVIETVPSQHYVYPIFKCGRSSLIASMDKKGWRFVDQHSIDKIANPITVFLREPKDRFVSGVNTFVQHLESQSPGLDQNTVLYFVNRYLFLNRHYAPQFFWLMNLRRFSTENTEIKLCGMSEISQLTDINSHANVKPISDQLQRKINNFDWSKLELYFYLDRILLDLVGTTINLQQLLAQVKMHDPKLFEMIFAKTINTVNVLSKT